MAVVLLMLLLIAVPVEGNTIYSYEGGHLGVVSGVYTLADRITGTVTLSDSFTGIGEVGSGVLSYTFTDGHQTLTEANSAGHFEFSAAGTQALPRLPADGATVELSYPALWWTLSISSPTGGLLSQGSIDRHDEAGLSDGISSGFNCSFDSRTCGQSGGAGTWTAQTVPEPTSLLLALAGFGGVAWLRRRRKRHSREDSPTRLHATARGK